MRDNLALTFLYRTAAGRMLLKLLVHPKVSKAAGVFLSSKMSRWFIPGFIRKNRIDMREFDIPQGGYASFNDFFTRRRKRGLRADGEHLISPCDGFLSLVPIRKNAVFKLKHTEFSLGDLLRDGRLAAKFDQGMAMVFRLTPANYHRYSFPADGRVICSKRIPGKLHCVRPIALREYPVFVQNSREYQVIETEKFGTVVQMQIGALLVGKIHNHRGLEQDYPVRAGGEAGYFEFGGSTILLLLQKKSVHFQKDLKILKKGGELPVRAGEILGRGA